MKITQPSKTQLNVEMPDKPETHVYTQLGMRYPDGTTQWGYDHGSIGGSIRFEDLDNPFVATEWRRRLERRAAAASIQLSEYLEGHERIKRTVIVAVTDAEEL